MLGSLRITLYDVFGYLIPGTVFLLGLLVLFWAVFFPEAQTFSIQPGPTTWIILLILAYYAGHVAQGLMNLVSKPSQRKDGFLRLADLEDNIPNEIMDFVRSKLSVMIGIEKVKLNSEWVFRICDEYIIRHGDSNNHEVYEYRSGFYRGSGVSFLLLSLALIIRAIMPGTSEILIGSTMKLSPTIFIIVGALSFAVSLLSFNRHRRFLRYRAMHSIAAFVALYGGTPNRGC